MSYGKMYKTTYYWLVYVILLIKNPFKCTKNYCGLVDFKHRTANVIV